MRTRDVRGEQRLEEPVRELTARSDNRVLLVGGTGRTGGRVLTQLLERGVPVRAIVRSVERLPDGVRGNPLLTAIEADVLSLPSEELQSHLEGCDTVISCLGHNISVRGILGPPFDLVARVASNIVVAATATRPIPRVRFILMSTVAANRPGKADTARGVGQRFYLWLMRALVPPARDNQHAADFFAQEVGASNPYVEWVAVRPDTLTEGAITDYLMHDELVSSIFHPDETNMANVAHFMCELTCDEEAWKRWRARMPVIVNAGTTP